jgi:uncharacterized protein YcgL (UPF0745 family)
MTTSPTKCHVYKSRRKRDTYVYLRDRDGFSVLPPELAAALGELTFVLELELTPERKLARELAPVVIEHLAQRGFHLQLPPVDPLQQ